jgi:hypothetical protein
MRHGARPLRGPVSSDRASKGIVPDGVPTGPAAAAISARTLFPDTLACSPAFHNGYLSGNLIATNGEWAYLAEYHQTNFSHDYFSVVPLWSVRLITIGRWSNCNSLAPAPTARP